MPGVPQRVRWTDHPYVKAGLLGAARADIEQAIIEHHQDRQSNPGATQWRLSCVSRPVSVVQRGTESDAVAVVVDVRAFAHAVVGVGRFDELAAAVGDSPLGVQRVGVRDEEVDGGGVPDGSRSGILPGCTSMLSRSTKP